MQRTSGFVGMGSIRSWEPIIFWTVDSRTHQFWIERPKPYFPFSSKKARNGGQYFEIAFRNPSLKIPNRATENWFWSPTSSYLWLKDIAGARDRWIFSYHYCGEHLMIATLRTPEMMNIIITAATCIEVYTLCVILECTIRSSFFKQANLNNYFDFPNCLSFCLRPSVWKLTPVSAIRSQNSTREETDYRFKIILYMHRIFQMFEFSAPGGYLILKEIALLTLFCFCWPKCP